MATWSELNKRVGANAPAVNNKSSWDSVNDAAISSNKLYNSYFETDQLKKESDRLNSFGGIASETIKGIGSRIANIGTGLKQMFTNPSDEQRAYEKQFIPEYEKGSFSQIISTPGRILAKGISRFINPSLQPFASDVGQIIAVNEKGGIADKIAAGEIPVDYLNEIAVLSKTAPQIVGDVAQAVLAAYSGSAATNLARQGAKMTLRQAAVSGAATGMQVGAATGVAQAASSGSKNVSDIINTITDATLAGGVFGTLVSSTAPAITRYFSKLKQSPIKLKVKGSTDVVNIPVNTPATRYAAYLKSQGYEPYIPNNKLPTIEMGTKSKTNLPTIEFDGSGNVKRVVGEYKYEPVSDISSTNINKVSWNEANSVAKSTLSDISRTSQKIQSQAASQGISIPTSKLSKISRMNMADDAVSAKSAIAQDRAGVLEAIRNKTDYNGIRPQTLFKEMKNVAINDGNLSDIMELASSNIGTETAQALKALDDSGRFDIDPVRAIQEIKEIRSKTKDFNNAKNKLKAGVDKIAKPTKQSWNEFLDSITC